MEHHTRRRFLRLAIASAAASSTTCGPPGTSPESFDDVSAGNVSALTVGAVVPLNAAPVFVARDAGGVYAMSTTCTHQGCDLGQDGQVSQGRISCGCHGAEFDANGAVLSGPAPSPLQHFAVSVDGQGNITVHGGSKVSANVRVSV
jgi:Rieske Fe-S protein